MKTQTNKIINGLSLAFSAVMLMAILAFLVFLVILFPTISSATASEPTFDKAYIGNTESQASYACAPAPRQTPATKTGVNNIISASPFKTGSEEDPPASEDAVYGLIGENVILFDDEMQPITGLPATYFVIILGEDENYYEVSYRDLSGFVEKIRIFKIDYEPRLKFGLAHFTAQNDTHPVIIREEPTSSSKQLATLPHREKTLYYGGVTGEALIPAAGTMWYFVNYNGVYGYVYSAQGSVESFAVNPGDKVVKPTTADPSPKNNGDSFSDWVLILILSVPAVIIMLALFGRAKSKPRGPQQI